MRRTRNGSARRSLGCPSPGELTAHLERALSASGWQERGDALAAAYVELARQQAANDIAPFEPVVGPYYERPFTTINADDAVTAALEKIEDPQIRALPVIGSVDQISDLTPVLTDPELTQRLSRQLG